MRFKRSDLIGMAIATLAPVGMFILFLNSYEAWHPHGTPVLAIVSTNLAIGAGVIGAFSRFIRHWDILGGLLIALALVILGVVALQRSGDDGTAIATVLKLIGVVAFGLINLVVLWEFLKHGVEPILLRREERRAEPAP